MRRLGGDQSGWTLIELMIGSAIMLVILGASLAAFDTFLTTNRRNSAQNDAQQFARASTTQLARQLRNLAGPTDGVPQGFDRLGAYDIAFLTVNPTGPVSGENASNVQRVRYCLDGGTPARLWTQTQSWTSATPPGVPSTASCPDGAWGNQKVVASYVVNRINNQDRPAFAFNSSDPAKVTEVRTDLYVDPEPTRSPPETHLQSGVFLRNQNQVPVANLQATPGNKGHVILNASASSDPEGQTLTYAWDDNGTKLKSTAAVWDYQTTSGAHTITVTVSDPSGLTATASQQVTVP
jgi:prepilin-type N-terminal cleavage/methylation domain-containing protein